MELMVWFLEHVEDFWKPIFFSEVPGAIRVTKCKKENEAYLEKPVSILSKLIVIYNFNESYESIEIYFRRF